MKLLITTFAALLLLVTATFVMTNQASAVNLFGNCGENAAKDTGTPTVCTDAQNGQSSSTNPILRAIRSAIEILSIIIGFASVIMIIVSGLRMTLANGDSNAIASARSSLLYSIVGLAVAALAQVIVRIAIGSVA